MKKFFILLIAILFLFVGCTQQPEMRQNKPSSENKKETESDVKSVWFAYYDLEKFTKGKTETEFTSSIDEAFNFVSSMGFNTVTVQVRPCADAFYKSDFFPVSQYFQGEQGSEMIYDPLDIICRIANGYNLSVEAWINPYRVSQSDDVDKLSDHNIAKQWLDTEKVKIVDKKIYFNPASSEVQKLIISGVEELVKKYPISAVHFDDYFYPTTKKSFDKEDFQKYKTNGGSLSLGDWRRNHVSTLIKNVYSSIKKINDKVKFGISPAGNIEEDYAKLYADIELWCSEEGYLDYICPQIYYGFRNENMPFMFTAKKWLHMVNTDIVDLYVGLPLYKAGKRDAYASSENDAAINEFKENTDIISRQITYLSKIDDVSGFYIFSYSDLISGKCEKEVNNMKSVMQSSNPL